MLTRSRKAIVASFLSAIIAMAVVIPASANTVSLNTGGCTGNGVSLISGAVGAMATDSSPACGWVYLHCEVDYGGGYAPHCPGWVNPPSGYYEEDFFGGPVAITASHSLCNVGGPCASSTYSVSHAP